MAIETLLANGYDNGWTSGALDDIDNGVDTPDGNSIVANTTQNGETALIDFANTAITDADTVNTVTVRIRELTAGSGNDRNRVNLLVSSVGQGQTDGALLGASFNDASYTNGGWDSDWTAAEIDSIQVTVLNRQTGMGATPGHTIDEIELEIDFTPAAADPLMGQVMM